ncbi:MAG: prephenate dehydrogenase/arogenate dehydrogenase family protein [Chloroflexi bacterium]|nr:prephenate dehydrogenase/arogenate dehydrogenase family protein [Chloroflexota bacterium]
MPNYTIIGLGRIGTSLGMAIRGRQSGSTRVIGYDAENNAQSLAQRMGAVDSIEWNMDRAVADADVVVVATPAGALYDVFDAIGGHLKPGAVVTDTSPSKRAVLAWAEELLPGNASFVGGNPLTGASITSQKDASGHIFYNAKWAVVTPRTAGRKAIEAVTDMIELVGAQPVFMDAHEHDSFAAATTSLPAVVAAAVMNAVSTSPSWSEISRFVGRDFDQLTSSAASDPASSHSAAATNSDMLIHWIDQLIERFQLVRAGLADEQERFASNGAVADSFVQAWEQRARLEAGVADRRPETGEHNAIPSANESMMGLFFGSRFAKVLGTGKEKKKDSTKYDRRKLN